MFQFSKKPGVRTSLFPYANGMVYIWCAVTCRFSQSINIRSVKDLTKRKPAT